MNREEYKKFFQMLKSTPGGPEVVNQFEDFDDMVFVEWDQPETEITKITKSELWELYPHYFQLLVVMPNNGNAAVDQASAMNALLNMVRASVA